MLPPSGQSALAIHIASSNRTIFLKAHSLNQFLYIKELFITYTYIGLASSVKCSGKKAAQMKVLLVLECFSRKLQSTVQHFYIIE